MVKVRFTRGTGLGGVGNDVNPGDVRNLPEVEARKWIARGRAVLHKEGKNSSDKKPEESAQKTDDADANNPSNVVDAGGAQ